MKNIESAFNLDADIIYTNHAAVAPWPRVTVEAVKRFADENGRMGSRYYTQWLNTESELRQRLARLVNAPSADDIALLKSTSEGLSVIAYGLAWQPGDNIVIAAEEFPSNRIVWESLQPLGVELRAVPITHAADPEQALIDAMDDHTRLLSISAVQYAGGLRMDLPRLGQACRAHDSLYCVDAIQQLGALDFDLQAVGADFVVADGHKWMLGPEGLALFYCRDTLRPQLRLNQYGWHMVEAMGDFDKTDWEPAADARRFECGSPNMLCAHALHASIGLLLDVGMETVETRVLDNTRFLVEAFSRIHGMEILSPLEPTRHSGIFTFRKSGTDMETLYKWLVDRGVVCALRGGGIRLSPHFYTPREQLERLVSWIEEY